MRYNGERERKRESTNDGKYNYCLSYIEIHTVKCISLPMTDGCGGANYLICPLIVDARDGRVMRHKKRMQKVLLEEIGMKCLDCQARCLNFDLSINHIWNV